MDEEEERITKKIIEIEKYLEQLESIIPPSLEEYQKDFIKKAACERYFEKIIEAVTDLGFILIRKKKLKKPESEDQSFRILSNANIISDLLAQKLIKAKGMRNIIAHRYGQINDELVFQALDEEIMSDTQEFIKSINKAMRK